MAIIKKSYEISVWDEKLGENGQKTEIKRAIIGADDMTYLGRATSPKFTKNLNGTHTLTFQLPSKFFDSEKGEYVHNEFCDYLFNERKVKLKHDGEWYEFYVKNITENKQFKSIIYQYTCEDAFIDELSRNGYGITFDTELYNNVEEIGTFTETILEDSIWEYDASKNWGDFTEYSEEKLFKIPIKMFGGKISGYKLNYQLKTYNSKEENNKLKNVFTGEERFVEMGDDIAREQKQFWDNGSFDKGIELLSANNYIKDIPNDGYVYIPYSCLSFCYSNEDSSTDKEGYKATETAQDGVINNVKSYYLAPSSIDPTSLIQFIAIPSNAEVQIDEAGLLVNKDYSYVMTLKDWNKCVNSNKWYDLEKNKIQEVVKTNMVNATSNKMVCYEGYLEQIGDVDLTLGKKISITDRTEINISEEIDQYVTVYNNKTNDFIDRINNTTEFTSKEWDPSFDKTIDYRICSSDNTRVIVPQLARNLIQNGRKMTDTSGWEVMKTLTGVNETSSSISIRVDFTEPASEEELPMVEAPNGLLFDNHIIKKDPTNTDQEIEAYKTFINFGIVGQEEIISKEQTYVLYIDSKYVQVSGNSKAGYEYTEIEVPDVVVPIIIGEGGYDSDGDYIISESNRITMNVIPGTYYFIRPTINIENPYFAIIPPEKELTIEKENKETETVKLIYNLKEAIFSKAYTKGKDFFSEIESNLYYKYSGRDIFFSINRNSKNNAEENNTIQKNSSWTEGKNNKNIYFRIANKSEFLHEEDIFEGGVYSYKKYFRQQLQAKNDTNKEIKDSFMLKSYLNNEVEKNGFNPTDYTEEDIKVVTDYIDLNQCRYYDTQAGISDKDCLHSDNSTGLCMYQKYGYCPYRFQSQKHCRKIRTLNGEKSNRFNLTQELSKIFEIYPIYYTEHKENGKIVTDLITKKDSDNKLKTYEKMRKKVFYITEKGKENKIGFRYEKNLSNISRTFDSKEIVTKLYVEDVDSELSKTGLCSIKTAEDNPSKDSYIIDFSYYIMRGLLDKNTTEADLYGVNDSDMGYLKQLGYYNTKYDELSNLIINLQDESYNELVANVEVNLTGIETAQQELNKIHKNLSRYISNVNKDQNTEENDTYLNYKIKYNNQKNILLGLIEDTFMTNNEYYKDLPIESQDFTWSKIQDANDLLDNIMKYGFKAFKREFLDTFLYKGYGLMGQYTEEYLQIQKWKKQRARYLEDINKISLAFYKKYEPFLKEGTWSDNNYLSDNSYYFGAKEVAKQGAIPKLTYNITVIDLDTLDKDYSFDIADSSYIEDIETFGINEKTGLPNRLKVLISGITYDLDIPTQNSLQIQNYTTQFEDLFQQISASVQSLSFNENIYKRSSNFTSTQNISEDSLQGGLSENQLTLIETDEKNIELDYTGQSGSDINNHANKYKLSGEGLFFSNNGGQTWNVGVTPKGINADYIKVGSLDASKISIIDGEYLYFLWDKGGITAYRTPQATKENQNYFQDFARFNKYGLSLVENNKIKLRAGYEYVGSADAEGAINKEKDLSSETRIGFYLYNNSGNPIFYTYTDKDETTGAKIGLAGEMFITDEVENTSKTNKYYEYSKKISLKKELVYTLGDKISSSLNISNSKYTSDDYTFVKIITKLPYSELNIYLPGVIKYLQDQNKISKDKKSILQILIEEDSQAYVEYDFLYENKAYVEPIKTFFNNKIIIFNKYDYTITDIEITLDESTSETLKVDESYIIKNKSYNVSTLYYNKECYYIDEQIETCFLLSEDDNSKTTSDIKVSPTVLTCYELNSSTGEYTTKTYNSVYSLSGALEYWKEISEKEMTSTSSSSQMVMYFNNTNVKDAKNIKSSESERIICCAKTKDKSIENIFSIIKNGNLYIGGEVRTKDGKVISNCNKMPNEISVLNSLLETNAKDSKILIDFDKLFDRSSNKTLYEKLEIAGAGVGPHRHGISSGNGAISSKEKTQRGFLPADKDKFYVTFDGKRYRFSDASEFSGFRASTPSLLAESFNKFCTSLFDLLLRGSTTLSFGDQSQNMKHTFTFSSPVVLQGNNYDFKFKDTWTTGVSGSDYETTGYGLVDPINGDE